MQLLVISSVILSALAAPQGYGVPSALTISEVGGGSYGVGGLLTDARQEANGLYSALYSGKCINGKVLNASGKCVQPIVNRNIYLYAAPERTYDYGPSPFIPKPKLNYNVIFVKTPEGPEPQEPIVVPPAQQQTVVYVLSDAEEPEPAKVIEIPDQPRTPEVYYVNYDERENPKLPGGIDLKSALKSANNKQGQFINPIKKYSRSEPYNKEDKDDGYTSIAAKFYAKFIIL